MFPALNPEGTTTAVIPVRNQRRALEWSLALASQNIFATITHEAGSDRWGLAVEQPHLERALGVLRQYQTENRGWGWHQELPWTEMTFHWGAMFWCVFLAIVQFQFTELLPRLRTVGILDSEAYHHGEWWRLFTAITLHADAGHLATNAVFGFLLFGLAMARYGAGPALLLSYLAGAAGNWLGTLLYSGPYLGLGASGMVMGALGLLAVQSIPHWRQQPHAARNLMAGVFGGSMLFLLLGTDPKSDLVAHLGGFMTGALLGIILGFLPVKRLLSKRVNLTCLALFMASVFTTWWLAAGML